MPLSTDKELELPCLSFPLCHNPTCVPAPVARDQVLGAAAGRHHRNRTANQAALQAPEHPAQRHASWQSHLGGQGRSRRHTQDLIHCGPRRGCTAVSWRVEGDNQSRVWPAQATGGSRGSERHLPDLPSRRLRGQDGAGRCREAPELDMSKSVCLDI